jgi:hypothetical protein
VPNPNSPSITGAVLSYLVPGLGQIVQGRIAKGVLFLVCVYTLFFYGVYLGAAEVKAYGRTFRVSSNVYIPNKWAEPGRQPGDNRAQPTGLGALINAALSYPRPQVLGQFFVGVAFWPAIIQHNHASNLPTPNGADTWLDQVRQTDPQLVVSNLPSPHDVDAAITLLYKEADKLHTEGKEEEAKEKIELAEQGEKELRALNHPILGDFMREPTFTATNVAFNAGDKRLEIAWVFTVIAGVLNVLVIFDALMGPAYTSAEEAKRKAA